MFRIGLWLFCSRGLIIHFCYAVFMFSFTFLSDILFYMYSKYVKLVYLLISLSFSFHYDYFTIITILFFFWLSSI